VVSLENVLFFTVPPTITSAGAVIVALIGARTGKRNEHKLHSIDRAVNGTEPHEGTLRENVQTLVERSDDTTAS
jgi:hypothetical protein